MATPAGPAAEATTPAPALVAGLRRELAAHLPFSQMAAAHVDMFLVHAQERYHPPGEVLAEPAMGPVREVFFIRQGSVTGVRGLAELSGGAFAYETGELFPVSAAMAGRPVTATYRATSDTFVLAVPAQTLHQLAARCPVFSDFVQGRVLHFLELSRRALQVAYASQALAEQSLETPLAALSQRAVATCTVQQRVGDALALMEAQRIGSVLVVDAQQRPVGILTRHDVLARIALPQVPLDTPIGQVMVAPVHSLTTAHTAQDAALVMSRHAIRHVPVTQDGRLVGIVSERDLFALQRLSLNQVGGAIHAAPDVPTLALVAQDIRRFARTLLGQGVQARQLTTLVSHLNDVLTRRVIALTAQAHGIDLQTVCWLALGSEGRSEQTISTDQDNALIVSDAAAGGKEAVRAFARDVNLALDACGYPLCRGGIMAGEPACCLTLRQWRERFSDWIEHGAPQDLLNASIFFDLRPIAGDEALGRLLADEVRAAARGNPRFLKQMALNALQRTVPLNWMGAVETNDAGWLDLKLRGTAIFVDAARLYTLAHGGGETGTRERLEAVGRRLGLLAAEYQGWCGGFEFLQMLRLRQQLETAAPEAANRVRPDALNDIDRRILRESLRMARSLQQRMQLDYER